MVVRDADLMRAPEILLYHSISDGPGPTAIPPAVFRRQLEILAQSGRRVIPLALLVAWLRGDASLPDRSVVITFDDGFSDFATVVFPALQERSWPATLLIAPAKVGGTSDWRGMRLKAPLLDWQDLEQLAAAGIEIGAHGTTHADLTKVARDAARREIVGARRMLEDRLGRRVATFAYPYGRSDPFVRGVALEEYDAALGTDLRSADGRSDLGDLPRIEMWYFRSDSRWRSHLEGQGGYLARRRVLRWIRSAASALVGNGPG